VCPKLFAVIALFGVSAIADPVGNLQLDLRFRSTTTQTSALEESLYFLPSWTSDLTSDFGLRLSHTGLNVKAVEYKGELEYSPLSFLRLGFRLAHSSYRDFGSSATWLLGRFGLSGDVTEWLHLFASIGWYERFYHLQGANVIPGFGRPFPDRDFVGSVGWQIRPLPEWSLRTELSTYERITVFNLNNPFVQATVGYASPESAWHFSFFTRYQIMLGFGRLDEWMMGVSVETPFE